MTMNKQKTLEERLHDGSRAREILENEQFNASFDAIETEISETWKNSPARDSVAREKCYDYLKLLHKLKAQLVSTLETGKLAEMELNRRKNAWEKLHAGWTSFTE